MSVLYSQLHYTWRANNLNIIPVFEIARLKAEINIEIYEHILNFHHQFFYLTQRCIKSPQILANTTQSYRI